MSLAFDAPRLTVIDHATSESAIHVETNFDGTDTTGIPTGVPFRDHILTALDKHPLTDLKIQASGDTHVGIHRTVEDTAIRLGFGLRETLGDKCSIRRFSDTTVPLDRALARAVVDVAGRPYIVHEGESADQEYRLIGGHLIGSTTRHALGSLTFNSGVCPHVDVLSGCGPHHTAEVQFKALTRALCNAAEPDPCVEGIPSTKSTP